MKIYFTGIKLGFSSKRLIKKSIKAVLCELDEPQKHISVCVNVVSENEIRELNRDLRGIDKVTDVLSFPSSSISPFEKVVLSSPDSKFLTFKGRVTIGDMALCLPEIYRQASSYDESEKRVLARLVIHSSLHLLGFDHIKDEDFAVMQPLEEKILSKVIKK